MNKTAFIAMLALGGAAHAQSSVTIYGIVDAAIVGERGGVAPMTRVTSGAASASRIGFKGDEALGNGLSAFFNLETGARIDTGELDATNTLFNRTALVGLKGDFGAVSLGRQYTPYHTMLVNIVDPFSTGYAGTSKNLFPDWGANIRTSNTIRYATPVLRGVDAEAFYSAGEQSTISAGRQFGGAVGYASGPLTLRVAYHSRNSDVAGTSTAAAVNHELGRNLLLGGSVDLRWAKLSVGYEIDKGFNSAPLGNTNNNYGGVKPTASTDGREVLLGLAAPIGPGKLMFSVMHKDDRTRLNQDAESIGIGYLYSLSKRTGLYAAYAHIRNRNGAGYTVANNTESGTGSTGYNLGIRQTF
jgi:predicted porin